MSGDREEKRSNNGSGSSFDPPPVYALSTSTTPDLLEDASGPGAGAGTGAGAGAAYRAFLKAHPEYQLTWIVDALRRSDFARLDRGAGAGSTGGGGECYADYMGGSLYPESLVRVHAGFLTRSILGNTHSVSNA